VARRRLDAELVRRGLVATRTQAQVAVRDGLVMVSGRAASKPSTLVDPSTPVELVGPPRRFVSRAGGKLEAALERFDVDVAARHGLDAGASTGGFTDCLLRRGAAHVVAVDVGYGQLAWSLRTNERVTVLERTNVRDLRPEDLPYRPEIVVADLSFISLRTVVPVLARVASGGADLVLLVKPQFEVGRERLGSGGVVRDPEAWRDAVRGVADTCVGVGLVVAGVMVSPLPGPAGNLEFPLLATMGPAAATLDLEAAIEEARGIRRNGVETGFRP
jgi:23S rRNA (cytidine1920-2'-O)/16S rRNA (cytidine1409-2'-O)-methyltransferase